MLSTARRVVFAPRPCCGLRSSSKRDHAEECREIIATLSLRAREQASIVAAVAAQRNRYCHSVSSENYTISYLSIYLLVCHIPHASFDISSASFDLGARQRHDRHPLSSRASNIHVGRSCVDGCECRARASDSPIICPAALFFRARVPGCVRDPHLLVCEKPFDTQIHSLSTPRWQEECTLIEWLFQRVKGGGER